MSGRAAQRRRLALLALLAGAPGGGLSRDKLVAYLWPENDTESARHLLSDSLYVLRKELGSDLLELAGEDVRLNDAALQVDVREFERTLEDGAPGRAVKLYAGPFLDGVHVDGAPELERWADGERRRLARRYAEALETLAGAAESEGDVPAAADWWRRLAVAEPASGRVTLRLMRALSAAGERAAALREAERHTAWLRDELGAEPEPEVEALAETLREEPPVHPAGGNRNVEGQPDSGVTRLVVLPFRMLRPDEETEFLAFSLPDAIRVSLAGLRSMVVRSGLAGVPQAPTPDLSSIAGDARADLVLSGTLLRIEDRLRITVELANAAEGTLEWSQTSEVRLGDLFALQDQLTNRILSSLRLPLSAREQKVLRGLVPGSARAYEYYLRANQLAYQARHWGTARELYLQSLEEDPRFAPAWARLARCYRLLGKFASQGDDAAEHMRRAEEAFQRALRLNPDLPLTQNLHAQLDVDLGRARAAMVRLLRRAREHPGDAELFAGLVHACRFCGLLDASLAAHHRARALDPDVPTSVHHTHWMRGDYEAALEETYGDIGYLPGLALASLGRTAEAVEILRSREEDALEPRVRMYVASLRAVLEEKRVEALEALGRAAPSQDAEALFYVGRSYARLGVPDRALAHLERAVDAGFVCTGVLRRDPWLHGLRADDGFRALIERARQGEAEAEDAFSRNGGEEVLGTATTAQMA